MAGACAHSCNERTDGFQLFSDLEAVAGTGGRDTSISGIFSGFLHRGPGDILPWIIDCCVGGWVSCTLQEAQQPPWLLATTLPIALSPRCDNQKHLWT